MGVQQQWEWVMTITRMLQSKVWMQVHGSGRLDLGKMGISSMRWDVEGVGSARSDGFCERK